MGNEVTNVFGDSAVMNTKSREEMARRAAESAQNSTRAGAPDGSDYMNFSGKRGLYTIGQDKRRVENDELWVLNIGSFEDGYICWKGGKPIATRMANIYTGVPVQTPDPQDQGPFDSNKGEGWQKAKGWVAKSIDENQQGYFKNNSISGVAEMADLIEECSRRMAIGQPCWPVFAYDMEEFESQGYKNFKPIFKVHGWLNDEQLAQTAEDDFDIDELIKRSASVPAVEKKSAQKAETKTAEKAETKSSAEAEADSTDAPEARGRRRRRSV